MLRMKFMKTGMGYVVPTQLGTSWRRKNINFHGWRVRILGSRNIVTYLCSQRINLNPCQQHSFRSFQGCNKKKQVGINFLSIWPTKTKTRFRALEDVDGSEIQRFARVFWSVIFPTNKTSRLNLAKYFFHQYYEYCWTCLHMYTSRYTYIHKMFHLVNPVV